jgi:ribonuclease HI
VKKINWGIIGTKTQMKRFAEALKRSGDSPCIAVVVPDEQRNTGLAEIFDAPSVYDDYHFLLHDAHIDAVYIGTPLAARKQIVLEALAAKKAVLSESPAALSVADFLQIQKKTEECEAFFMETVNVKKFIATFAETELQPAETPHPENMSVLQDTDAAPTQDANTDFEFGAEIAEMIRCLHLREKGAKLSASPLFPHSEMLTVVQILEQCRIAWRFIRSSKKSTRTAVSNMDSSNATDTDIISNSGDIMKNAVGDSVSDTSAITVYTDGACRGNPGQGGWAAIITADGKGYEISGGEKTTTNNRMELSAAIAALKKIANIAEWRRIPITIYSDSQYLKGGITAWIHSWKKRGWITSDKTPVKNKELWVALDELNKQLNVRWNWVKGHAGNRYNERCDTLARNESHKFQQGNTRQALFQ